MIRKAVIPAAGFGTRMLPVSKVVPKELLPVVDKPVIQYVVEEAVASGLTDILIVVSRGKEGIEAYFDPDPALDARLREKGKVAEREALERIADMADIHFVRQKEMRGLGDAVACARRHVGDEPFAVLLGDTLIDASPPLTRQLMDVFETYGGPVIALEEVSPEKVERYGIAQGDVLAGNVYQLTDLVEKPDRASAPSSLAVAARYVLTPEVFDALDATGPGKLGEIQLTDALRSVIHASSGYGLRFQGSRFDVGNPLDLLKTGLRFALARDDLKPALAGFVRDLAGDMREAPVS